MQLEMMSPDVNMKVKLMKTIPFFSYFSGNDLAHTAQISDWLKFIPGNVILQEGEPGTSFCIVLKGSVRVVKRAVDDFDKILAYIPAGECFGEMSLISGQPRTAHIIANEEVFLFKIDGHKLGRTPEGLQLKFYKKFAEVLAGRLARTSQTLTEAKE